jgi:hypothetical protein
LWLFGKNKEKPQRHGDTEEKEIKTFYNSLRLCGEKNRISLGDTDTQREEEE